MSLSGRTQKVVEIALADRLAAKEVNAALNAAAWNIVALELSTGTSASAAFAATLHVGDLVEVTTALTGATAFAAVTTAGTVPALTIASGDLIRATRKAPVGNPSTILPSPHA